MERSGRRLREMTTQLRGWIDAAEGELRVVRSPLRVCPLGAHIDHQLGKVTGVTLDEAVLLVFRPREDSKVTLRSLDFDGEVSFDLDDIGDPVAGEWGNYPKGAAWVMRETYGIRQGLDGVLSGPLPIGGLSSSAAVDVAYLLALQDANGLVVDGVDSIRLAQRIENDYIGLNNGILDQSIILQTRRGALTYLDCLDLTFDFIPAPRQMRFDIVIAFSGLSRALVGTDYNQRVAECQDAARRLLELAGEPVPDDPRLRQVPVASYHQHADALPEKLARRARHFFEEMARVEAGVEAWKRGDLMTLGALMRESGRSSIENYECGSPHLIALYEILNETSGVYGARFSGAGFRGSCVALSDPDKREQILTAVGASYPARHPDVAESYSLHFCQPSGRAEVVECRL